MHPICPVVTYHVFQRLYDKDIMLEKFPEGIEPISDEERNLLDMIMKANSKIWSRKKELKLSLNSPLEEKVMISKSLEPFVNDLKVAHKLIKVEILEKDIPEVVSFQS
jgi:valyl-tRNA synthetase